MLFSLLKKVAVTLSTAAVLAGSLIVPSVSAQTTPNIVQVAQAAAPEFSTLVTALTAADLVSTLSGTSPFTVFAPTNAAFAALPAGVLDKLLLPINKPTLVRILTYHAIPQSLDSTALATLAGTATPTVVSSQGGLLKLGLVNQVLTVNTNSSQLTPANVITANIPASNGIVHSIDKVMLPGNFNAASLQSAPATSGGGTITIGDNANTSSSSVVTPTNNIVQTAVAVPTYSTFVAAIKAADLVDTLSGTGPFTVLAPTNDAFAKVPADVLAKLLLPENKDALVKVLTYHVIAGKVDAAAIVKLTSTKTVQGSDIKIAVVDGKVTLNDVTTVLKTDIQTSNGIIHRIDSVLLPADLDLSKLVSANIAAITTVDVPKIDTMKGENTIRTGGDDSLIVASFVALVSIVTLGFITKFILSKKNS